MILINLIKMFAIWLADTINLCYYPFLETHFAEGQVPLKDLEEHYAKDLEANFKAGWLFLYETPIPEDRGDHALFQGLYTGMRALKGGNIDDAIEGLGHFFLDDTLIRGYWDDGRPNDTTSNDSATGALFGLYCVWKYNGPKANPLILRWADKVVKSDYALTDLSGEPTKYGKLADGIMTDPLRITLLLALLALARKIDSRYDDIYERIYNRYREILPYPKVKLLWWDTDYDTHRAAIHLHILYMLTGDLTYKAGLRRLHRICRAETNPWVNILCSPALGLENVNLSLLNTFETAMVRTNVRTQNSHYHWSVKWGKKLRAKSPLPIYRRGSQEFFWQRNPFSLDEWPNNEVANKRHSSLDFLLCYWMAKRLGLTSWLTGVKL